MADPVQSMSPLDDPKRKGMRLLVVGLWCLCSLVYGILLSIVGPTASILAERTHSTAGDLAPVLGLGGIMTIIGGIPSGWAIDHFPGNPLLAATLAFQALGYAILPLCPSIWVLAIVYATVALSFNIINTGLNVMVIWSFTEPSQLTLVLNTVSFMFGIGGILAPQLVTLANKLGDGALCYYMASCMVAAVALALAFMPSPKYQPPTTATTTPTTTTASTATTATRGAEDDANPSDITVALPSHCCSHPSHLSHGDLLPDGPLVLHGGAATATATTTRAVYHDSHAAQADMVNPVVGHGQQGGEGYSHGGSRGHCGGEGHSHSHGKPALQEHHNSSSSSSSDQGGGGHPWSVLVPALLVVFANVSIELGFAAWIFTYALEIGNMGEVAAENMTSLFWILFTAGRGVAAVLATCVSGSTLLLASMPLAVVGSIVPLVAPGSASTVIAVVLVGLGSACGFPSTLSIAAEFMHLNGSINGIISTVAGLSMTLMPSLVPLLAKQDPNRGFTWLMLATLFMAVLQLGTLVQLLVAGAAHKRAALHRKQQRGLSPAGYGDEDELQAPLLISSSAE